MTVALTSPRFSYAGDGSTTQFGTPYFLTNSDIVAILRKADDSTETWTLGTQYTLSGAGDENGGTLTVNTSPTDYTPASGETLVIATSPPLTQATDYPSGGPFPALAHENALDKLTLIAQFLAEVLDRTFLVPIADSQAGSLGTLPIDSDRANMALGFDANGNPVAIPAAGASTHTIQDLFAGDGSTVNFTLSGSPVSESATFVFVDGVRQQTDTYSLSGTTLTFSEAPPGDGVAQNIEVVHLQELDIGAPSDETVTAGKLVPTAAGLEAIITKLNTATNKYGSAQVTATGSTTARTLAARFADFVNVKDFGAVGDGSTDDAAAFQAAIDAVDLVLIPPGAYRIGAALQLRSNVQLVGAGMGATVLDYTQDTHAGTITIADGAMVYATGTLGSDFTFDAQVDRGATALSFESSGVDWSAGDWVHLRSSLNSLTEDWTAAERLGDRAGEVSRYGEIAQITDVSTAKAPAVRGAVVYRYPATSVGRKITPVENILIEGITFQGTPSAADKRQAIAITWGHNVVVRGCEWTQCYQHAVQFRACWHCVAYNNQVHIRPQDSPVTESATDWQAFKVIDCCTGVAVIDNLIENPTQGIDVTYTTTLEDTDGPPRNTLIARNRTIGSTYSAYVDHPGCEATAFIDNVAEKCSGGILVRSRFATVLGNRLRGMWFTGQTSYERPGIWLGENGFYIRSHIEGNFISDFEQGVLIAGANASFGERSVTVRGGQITRCRVGVDVGVGDAAAIGSGIVVDGVHLSSIEDYGVLIDQDNDSPHVVNCRIRGPIDSAGAGIRVDTCVRPFVFGNTFDSLGVSTRPINLTGCTNRNVGLNSTRGTNAGSLDTDGVSALDIFTPNAS